MVRTIRTERRKRGFIGQIFRAVFWLYNAAMAALSFSFLVDAGETTAGYTADAEKVGAGLGIVIGMGMIFSLWAAGSAILGLLSFMTRGHKVIVEEVAE